MLLLFYMPRAVVIFLGHFSTLSCFVSEHNYESGKTTKQNTNFTSVYYLFWLRTSKTKIVGLIPCGPVNIPPTNTFSIHMNSTDSWSAVQASDPKINRCRKQYVLMKALFWQVYFL